MSKRGRQRERLQRETAMTVGGKVSDIRQFRATNSNNEAMKDAVWEIGRDMLDKFTDAIKSREDALAWVVDCIPNIVEEAGLPPMDFEPAEGLHLFFLNGLTDEGDDFPGVYSCFTKNCDGEIESYDIVVFVSDEGEYGCRIDALLIRAFGDGAVEVFLDGEWLPLDSVIEDRDDGRE